MRSSLKSSKNYLFLKVCLAASIFTTSWDLVAVDIGGFTIRLTQLLILPIIALWFFSVMQKGRVALPLGGTYLLIWIITQFIFMFRSPNLKNAIGYFLWLCFNAFSIFAVSYFVTVAYDLKWLVRVYILSYVFAALEGLAQFMLYPFGIRIFVTQAWNTSLARINGYTFEPSFYATYLLIGFVFVSYLLEAENTDYFSVRHLKYFFIILLSALILSTSRMGWLMVGLWFAFRACIKLKSYAFRGITKKQFIVLLLLFILVPYLATAVFHFLKTHSFLLNGLGFMGTASHSVTGRANEIITCLQIFLRSPWIGYSLGGIDPIVAQYKGLLYSGHNGFGANVFAEALVANGIIGLIPFLSYLKILIYGNWEGTNSVRKAFAYSLCFELLILCMNQNILRPYLWMHIAILSAEYRNDFVFRRSVRESMYYQR